MWRLFANMKVFGRNINLNKFTRLFFVEESEQRGLNHTSTLSNPANWFTSLFGGRTSSGVTMTEDKALSLSALWSAVRIKADMVASLPFQLYAIDDNDNRTLARQHEVNRLISKRPHKHLTSYQFRHTMQILLELRGNAFAHIIRNPVSQRPTELRIIKPSAVTIEEMRNGDIYYKWFDNLSGQQMRVPYLDMIHLRNFSCDGLQGLSPINMGRENLALAVAAQEYEAAFFGNGAHISGFLSYPGKLGDDQKKNIAKSWRKRFGGFRKAGGTPVLEGAMDYKRIGLTPQESMLSESRKLSVEDISRWFNVPLYMLSALDRMSFNNIEQIARDFINKSLRPVARNWQEEFDMKLLRNDELMTHETGFDFTELLKGDSEKMGEFIRTLTANGVISIDEGRRMIGKNTLNTDWSQQHWMQLNTAPTDEESRVKYIKNNKTNSKETKSAKRPISFSNKSEVDPQLNQV